MKFEKIYNFKDYIKKYKQPSNFATTCCFTSLSEANHFGVKDGKIYPMSEIYFKKNHKDQT